MTLVGEPKLIVFVIFLQAQVGGGVVLWNLQCQGEIEGN